MGVSATLLARWPDFAMYRQTLLKSRWPDFVIAGSLKRARRPRPHPTFASSRWNTHYHAHAYIETTRLPDKGTVRLRGYLTKVL